MHMDDEALLRYSRHILLNEIGVEQQEKLLSSTALMVGAGGLGSTAGLFLASAGVGQIIVADDDQVDLTNLQRQIAHQQSRLGQPKAESIRQSMLAINPTIDVQAITQRLDASSLAELLATVDVVLDCTDNFTTRHAINRACVQAKVPLVSGSAIQFDAQIAVFHPAHHPESGCYYCMFPEHLAVQEVACATMGVFAPMVGIVGATQAAEALKVLMGIGQPIYDRLLILNALDMQWHAMKRKKDPTCPVCQDSFTP